MPSCILFSTSLLLNFPKIIHMLHSKVTTIEDLEDIRTTDKQIQNRFITIFEITLTFMMAIMIGVVIEYYQNKIEFSNLYNMEILGIFGGILGIMRESESTIAKCLLVVLKRYKQYDYSVKIEMTDITGNQDTINMITTLDSVDDFV